MKCDVDWCQKEVVRRKWCISHYKRWERHGDPLGGRKTYNGDILYFIENVILKNENKIDCVIWPFSRHKTEGWGAYAGTSIGRYICTKLYGSSKNKIAAHSCGNGHLGCCNKHHLRWATYKENSEDMKLHGQPHGPKSIINNENAKKMVEMKKQGLSFMAIATHFNVGASTVSRAIDRIKDA